MGFRESVHGWGSTTILFFLTINEAPFPYFFNKRNGETPFSHVWINHFLFLKFFYSFLENKFIWHVSSEIFWTYNIAKSFINDFLNNLINPFTVPWNSSFSKSALLGILTISNCIPSVDQFCAVLRRIRVVCLIATERILFATIFLGKISSALRCWRNSFHCSLLGRTSPFYWSSVNRFWSFRIYYKD